MSAPPFNLTARPGNFGPDHSQTDEKPNFQEAQPSRAAQKAKDAIGSLGDNTRARSGVRKLGESDREWIVRKYLTLSKTAKPFHYNFSEALAGQAEECADAWMGVAEKNDKVRRQILAAIEGGAWTELFVSHGPIVIALLPERFLNKVLDRSMELFGTFLNRTSGDDAE